jgi:signal transduction histidine kinase
LLGRGAAGATSPVSELPLRRTVERRPVVLAAAVVLLVAVFVWRSLVADTSDQIALLYVVPIALAALELGLQAGIAAALLGLALLVIGSDVDDRGAITCAVAFLAVGAIAGRFSDRMQDGQRRYRLLLQSGLTLAHLDADADLPRALADHAREFMGSLRVEPRERLSAEDRAVLAILDLQAAVAAENRQLLESERERAVIEAELRATQVLLAERGVQLRAVMAHQEAERGQISSELHDDAAQVLAAVLMGLKALELQLGAGGSDGVRADWETLRNDIDSTLQLLRTLAISLRPPILRLGLQAALEDLGENVSADEFEVDLAAGDPLDPELETMVYRIVEEVLHAIAPPRRIHVTGADGTLVIDAKGSERELESDRLRILTARAELIGGTVVTSPTGVRVVIGAPPTA